MKIVEFPLEDINQAKDMTMQLLEQELVVVTRLYENVYQQWVESGKVDGGDLVIVRARVEDSKLNEAISFIKENHPWSEFCLDVIDSESL